MSFARATRFRDESGEMSPMTHQLPIKYCTFVNGVPKWMKLNSNDALQSCSKDHNSINKAINEKNNEKKKLLDKRISQYRAFHQDANKENSPVISPNSRLKLSDSKAPSFMSRPKIIHRCISNEPEKTDNFHHSNFNRNSTKRKSIRLVKKAEHDKFIDENNDKACTIDKPIRTKVTAEELLNLPPENTQQLQTCRDEFNHKQQIRKQGTFIIKEARRETPKVQFLDQSIINNSEESDAPSEILPKGEIPQHLASTRIISDGSAISYIECDQSLIGISKFDLQQFLEERRNKAKETERWVAVVRESLSNAKTFLGNIGGETDGSSLVSVGGNFIDDEYDSYLDKFAMATFQDIGADNLYHICTSLLSSYSSKGTRDTYDELPIINEQKKKERSRRKLFTKKKNKEMVEEDRLRQDVERVIKSIIAKIKVQFKREIYRNTECKLNELIGQIIQLNTDANRSTDLLCQEASNMLMDGMDGFIKY